MPPIPNNQADQGSETKGSEAPKGAPSNKPGKDQSSPAPASAVSQTNAGVEIELDEEFIHHGKIYGPGKLRVRDDGAWKADAIANDLRESQERIRAGRRPGEAILRPNRTITGIQPGTELDDHISNALSPEDVAKMREDAEAQAQASLRNDQPPMRQKRAAAIPAKGSQAGTGKGGGSEGGGGSGDAK